MLELIPVFGEEQSGNLEKETRMTREKAGIMELRDVCPVSRDINSG